MRFRILRDENVAQLFAIVKGKTKKGGLTPAYVYLKPRPNKTRSSTQFFLSREKMPRGWQIRDA